MDVFGDDALIGNYRLSDHGLRLATFNYQDTYNLGATSDSNMAYLGRNPKPAYLGSKPNSVLELTFTVIQDFLKTGKTNFTLNECRDIISRLTGYQGYRRLYLNNDKYLENVYYNVVVDDVEYEKCADEIVGIRFQMKCDSPFGWVDQEIKRDTTANDESYKIYNTSDVLYDYMKPIMVIHSDSAIDGLEITNLTDNGFCTMIDHVNAGEIITINSSLGKITSTMNTNFSEIFNNKFPRLVSGENEILISHPLHVTYKLALPRKIGVM